MPRKYTSEEIEKILQNLPEELKEALFSLETAEVINNACEEYGIIDERVGKIADYVGQIIMGLLPLSEFQKTIEKEVVLPPVLAKVIAQEINRFIFYPIRPALEQLYEVKVTSPEKTLEKTLEKPSEQVKIEEEKLEGPKALPRKDVYREPIE